MKKIDGKMLSLTLAVCLLPIVFGIVFYQKMPEMVAIHFNMNNEVDRYASKNFALFGIPVLMIMLQIFCCAMSDWRGNQERNKPKFVVIVKWIIPVLSVIISVITISVALGNAVDVRKWIILVIGILWMMIGNYLPKMSYEQMKGKVHPMPKSENGYKKMARMLGYTFVIFGFILLITILAKPWISFMGIVGMVFVLLMETIYICVKKI